MTWLHKHVVPPPTPNPLTAPPPPTKSVNLVTTVPLSSQCDQWSVNPPLLRWMGFFFCVPSGRNRLYMYPGHCVKGEPARSENSQRGDRNRLEVFSKFPFQSSGAITLIKLSGSFNKVLIKPRAKRTLVSRDCLFREIKALHSASRLRATSFTSPSTRKSPLKADDQLFGFM